MTPEPELCGEPNPGLDGGYCNHVGKCKGRHSWQPAPAAVVAVETTPSPSVETAPKRAKGKRSA